jgi:hypothetical protein
VLKAAFFAAVLATVIAVTAVPTSAQETTVGDLLFVHAYGDAPGESEVDVCLVGDDGFELVESVESGDVVAFEDLEAGTYEVVLYETSNVDDDCENPPGAPVGSTEAEVTAGGIVSVAAFAEEPEGNLVFGERDHDVACLDPGRARLTTENLANVIEPVIATADGPTPVETEALSGGEFATGEVEAGDYDIEFTLETAGTLVDPPGTVASEVEELGETTIVLAGGVGDPDYWSFEFRVDVEACPQPTTTVTAPPVASPAPITAAVPAFTG